MSCTRRGFLKTFGAAMVGLGLTRLEPLRTYAASSVANTGAGGELGGPVTGPFGIDSVRQRAVDAAHFVGDTDLAHELSEVCCWAPAASAIRRRPLDVQARGAEYFFQEFPGGDQLAQVLQFSNNTSWRRPQFRFDPESLVSNHYEQLQKQAGGIRMEVLRPSELNGAGTQAELGLVLDRQTGDRLASVAERAEPMWAALSIFAGILLDPTDGLSRRLNPLLSLNRPHDRAVARTASVRYSQVVIGAVQRAIWSDQLEGANPALPLVQLTASGYLPLGEEDGRFLLLDLGNTHAIGYRTANV